MRGFSDAEDEDEARGEEAAQAHGLGQAQARGRLEAAQARGQRPAAPPQSTQEQDGRQIGRAEAASPRPLSVIEEESENATGKRWSEDAPTAQEDPQEGEGLLRRATQALQDRRRNGAARGRLRLQRPQAEEARGAVALDRADQRRVPS